MNGSVVRRKTELIWHRTRATGGV